LRLRPFRISDWPAVQRRRDELMVDGFDLVPRFEEFENWSHYVSYYARGRLGVGLRARDVPMMMLAAEVDGAFVGTLGARLVADESRLPLPGHVGYAVFASYRRRGYATEMLRQALIILRAEGVTRVLVACHDDNVASATVIERCGGELEAMMDFGRGVADMRRYAIAPPTGSLWLRPLRVEDEAKARDAHEAILPEDSQFLLNWTPETTWSSYLDQVRREHRGENLEEGRVRGAFLAAAVDDELVGRASVRFSLNDWLAAWGGHIGYAVLHASRRQGFASEILRQALVVARAEGVDRVVMTCFDDNQASARVIERHEGVLNSTGLSSEWPGRMRRYYVE